MHQPVTSPSAAQAMATRAEARAQQLPFAQNASEHREGRDAHGRAHEQCEAGEGYAVVGEAGIKIQRKKGSQQKWRGDADVAGEQGGSAVAFEFFGIGAQAHEKHENDHADLA